MSSKDTPTNTTPPLSGDKERASYGEYLRTVFSDYVTQSACKRLVQQVVSLQESTKLRTIAVISDQPGEGRSFFSVSLALGYAQLLGKNVLLVDAVHQTFGRALYLDRILENKSIEGGKPRVFGAIDLVTTKSDSGTRQDNSDFQLVPYINALRDRYDIVVFDTCALSQTSRNNMDPVIIAKQVDGAILLTTRDSLNKNTVERIKDDCARWGIKLLGTVFNEFES